MSSPNPILTTIIFVFALQAFILDGKDEVLERLLL